MSNFINADGLVSWANEINSQSEFPRVIRRLIMATVNIEKMNSIQFRAGTGTQFKGWDGVLNSDVKTAYFPKGISVWEIGTNKDIKGKANKEYENRTDKPLGVDISKTEFVFVTPRRWSSKDDWAKEKQNENKWKKVTVYDADDIENWLCATPSVNTWLSEKLGKRPKGLSSLDSFWQGWVLETEPKLNAALHLVGRKNEENELFKVIESNEPQFTSIKSSSQKESIAFFYSVIDSFPNNEDIISKTIIVENEEAWKEIVLCKNNLFLVPLFNPSNCEKTIENGHFIFLPTGPEHVKDKNTVEVKKQHFSEIAQELINLGMKRENAYKISEESKGFITSLRRILSKYPESNSPEWSLPEYAPEIVPFVLIGSWSDTNQNDKKVIEKVTKKNYSEVEVYLNKWVNKSDSFIRKVDNIFQVISLKDSWKYILKYISDSNLEIFSEICIDVLGEKDPSYDLPKDKRVCAYSEKKLKKHSNAIFNGLSNSLAVLASYSQKMSNESLEIQSKINSIVSIIFDNVKSWKDLASISDFFQDFAEAAPDIFLENIKKIIHNDKQRIIELFKTESTEILQTGSQHTQLLWALESLAWFPDYFSSSVNLLIDLMETDPGGKLSNRPERSLKNILSFWNPQTYAGLEQKKVVVTKLLDKKAEITLPILLSILPDSVGGFMTPNPKPKWREIQERDIDDKEKFAYLSFIKESLFQGLSNNPAFFPSEEHFFKKLLNPNPSRLIDFLAMNVLDKIDSNKQLEIRDLLRDTINKHRKFKNSNWAFPENTVKDLEKCFNCLEPKSVLDKYSWLFNSKYPNIINPIIYDKHNYNDDEEKIEKIRIAAVRDIFNKAGFDGFQKFLNSIKEQFILGYVTQKSSCLENSQVSELFDIIKKLDTESLLNFLVGYFKGYFDTHDWIETEKFINLQINEEKKIKAKFLDVLPFRMDTWAIVEKDKDVEKTYWQNVNIVFIEYIKDSVYAFDKMSKYNRYLTAVSLISNAMQFHKNKYYFLPLEVVKVLLRVNTNDDYDLNNDFTISIYNIENLFKFLYETEAVSDSHMRLLEWRHFYIFKDSYLHENSIKPKCLFKELSKNPDFFVEVLGFLYKSENEVSSEDVSQEMDQDRIKLMADISYSLLNVWKDIPGKNKMGIIELRDLEKWIKSAREKSKKAGILKGCDISIGKLLSYSIEESDGSWPIDPIKDVIDNLDNEIINENFEVQIYNNRGVVSKGIYEGGAQEKDLEKQYKEYFEMTKDRWPVTASILKKVSESYKRDAKKEDFRKELR